MRLPLPTLLLATASAATLALPALADSYFFRSKPLVSPPRAFSFADAPTADPNTSPISAVAQVKGYRGKSASVSGGEYQVCSVADCSDQAGNWRTAATTGLPDDFYARVRVAAAAFGNTATATLTVGGTSASFSATTRAADTDPKAVSFPDSTDLAATTAVPSAIRKLEDHDGIGISVSAGDFYRLCSNDNCSAADNWTQSPSTAARDQFVQLRTMSPAAGAGKVVTLTYGSRTATWSVKSKVAGPTMHSVADMGIVDPNLRSAIEGVVGTSKNWTLCYEWQEMQSTCAGAAETMVVHTDGANGYTYGGYVKGDFWSNTTCWRSFQGFYFTNAHTRTNYVQSHDGSGLGTIRACTNNHLAGLYSVYAPNAPWYANSEGYTGGSTTGLASGKYQTTTVRWYRR